MECSLNVWNVQMGRTKTVWIISRTASDARNAPSVSVTQFSFPFVTSVINLKWCSNCISLYLAVLIASLTGHAMVISPCTHQNNTVCGCQPGYRKRSLDGDSLFSISWDCVPIKRTPKKIKYCWIYLNHCLALTIKLPLRKVLWNVFYNVRYGSFIIIFQRMNIKTELCLLHYP